jgi:hypothetical protein
VQSNPPSVRHGNPNELSTVEPNDDQAIEQVEGKRRHHEQVHRRDFWHVIAQKRPPALTRRSDVPFYVFGDNRLRDLEAELGRERMPFPGPGVVADAFFP